MYRELNYYLGDMMPGDGHTEETVTQYFYNLKFGKNYSVALPLKSIVSFSPNRAGEQNWLVQRVEIPYYYYEWFALPSDHDYLEYPNKNNSNQQKAQRRPDILYEFRSLDPAQPIEQILIGLHPKQQLSILVFFRPGVVQKCFNGLFEDKTTPYTFLYATHVGFDIRARASQFIGCNNASSVEQVCVFMQALHQISPFNEKVMTLWSSITIQAQNQITNPVEWLPDLDCLGDNKKLSFQLESSVPNGIPDSLETNFLTYHPEDIKNFPTDIPEIHQAILENDTELVRKLVSANSYHMYQRDPWGKLPIETADSFGAPECTRIIYQAWSQLKDSEKILAKVFFEIVSKIGIGIARGLTLCRIEQSNITNKQAYYQRLYPNLPNAWQIHKCVQLNDEEGYQKLRDKNEALQQYASLANMKDMLDENIPKRPWLHQQVLLNQSDLNGLLLQEKQTRDLLSKRLKDLALSLISIPQAKVFDGKEAEYFLKRCQPIFATYRCEFPHVNDAEYVFYIQVMALSLYREAQKQLQLDPITIHDVHHFFVEGWLKELKEQIPLSSHSQFECFHILNANYNLAVSRRNLFLSEQQDPWGYTPFILAVVASNKEVVKICASLQLGDLLKKDKDRILYSVLDHAHGSIIETLCHLGHDPNKQDLTIFSRNRHDEYWLLMFYRYISKRDYRLLTPIEQLLISTPTDINKALELLDVLLKYHDGKVVEGPYDPHIPEKIIKRLDHHNKEIDRKNAFVLNWPRYNGHHIESIPNIGTVFVTILSHSEKTYRSVICRFEQMSMNDKNQIIEIFCQNFYMIGDDDQIKCKEFFEHYILNDNDYFIETHYDGNTGEVVGFATFKLITCPDMAYDVFYFSMVATHKNYTRQGLLFSSMKNMRASFSDSSKPCIVYCRLGRPGLAYTFIPKSAAISTKYNESNQYLEVVALIAHNRIEEDGTSLPPVHVRAQRDSSEHYHVAQDEYEYLIDSVLRSHNQQASLPVVFPMNKVVAGDLQHDLQRAFGFPESLCQELRGFLINPVPLQQNTQPQATASGI